MAFKNSTTEAGNQGSHDLKKNLVEFELSYEWIAKHFWTEFPVENKSVR